MKSHYVPEFYLKEFATAASRGGKDPRIWAYDKKYGKWNSRSPGQVCKEAGLYAVSLANDPFYNGIELHYRDIENDAAPVIRRIVEGDHITDGRERASLAAFMASLFGRTPLAYESVRDQMLDGRSATAQAYKRNPDVYEPLRAIYKHESGKELTDEMVERWCDPVKFGLQVTKREVLINIFLSYLLTAHRIRSMAWTFHHTDEEHRFITSDNPMQVYDPKNPHSVDLDDERYETFRGVCPLSQEVCWEGELSQSETRYVYCDEAKAAQLNTLQARGAARYVIAPTKDFPASDVIHHPRGG